MVISVFMGRGLADFSLRYHPENAKKHGVTKKEIAAIVTHAAFYAGWPMAWAVFNMAKEVWKEEAAEDAKAKHASEMVFPIGEPNPFGQYFIGEQVPTFNVTFAPGCPAGKTLSRYRGGCGKGAFATCSVLLSRIDKHKQMVGIIGCRPFAFCKRNTAQASSVRRKSTRLQIKRRNVQFGA